MVFFTCNACGESLKKNQVEKHYMHKCRRCEVLTCVDCHKDFPGDSYQAHTKCITESEKYSAKGWQPKAGANKGEKKQLAWIENIQNLLQNEKEKASLSPDVRRVLDTVINHENIPRKKQKFTNFVKNIMRGVRPSVIDETWGLFEEALKPAKVVEEEKKDDPIPSEEKETDANDQVEERLGVKMFQGNKTIGEQNGTKKKKKKSKKQSEKENEKLNGQELGKKRKCQEMDEDPENEIDTKKKKKKKEAVELETEKLNDTLINESSTTKFSWEETIEEILQKKGSLKLSKLKKKVINSYVQSVDGGQVLKTHEELGAKLEKKLKKNKKFKLLKDTVQLVDC